ncbi:hypothetical protein KCP73_15770 [Salmonella enterica subsp. enterica]|nr:hypothetical protein KCP73_15770 [Salmonella enterica subsp. enterica]
MCYSTGPVAEPKWVNGAGIALMGSPAASVPAYRRHHWRSDPPAPPPTDARKSPAATRRRGLYSGYAGRDWLYQTGARNGTVERRATLYASSRSAQGNPRPDFRLEMERLQ